MFGPWVIILHRLFDNFIYGKFLVPTDGLKGALLTLVWFWIPAHSVTFYLPPDQQITLAAIWSFVLGLILGIFNNRKKKS
jgi:peptidoglycan/LPS O-acetylase OafA/YrhL